jgi:hypothetical protein
MRLICRAELMLNTGPHYIALGVVVITHHRLDLKLPIAHWSTKPQAPPSAACSFLSLGQAGSAENLAETVPAMAAVAQKSALIRAHRTAGEGEQGRTSFA